MRIGILLVVLCLIGCRDKGTISSTIPYDAGNNGKIQSVTHARGFEIDRSAAGITIIRVLQPWPDATDSFIYALVPRNILDKTKLDRDLYDAVIPVPVENIVVTSTTHIPALEALGVADRLVGFPGTNYISSEYTRKLIDTGAVANLGNNEMMNTEMTLGLSPDLVVGFGITSRNKAYETLIRSGIPVVYNGDWTEQTPLGKAEWIKFFAPFFRLEEKADSIFDSIEQSYTEAQELAGNVKTVPTVMSGALYKDVWYAPGGRSWAAQFIRDANGKYLWDDTRETGSLSLSVESVLERASDAEYWVAPSQYTSYEELENANRHYREFRPFKDKKVFTYALSKGETGGLIFFELGPNRPDLILRDLIHIFHPEILPEHSLYFFKPLN